ncbi:hypothetical protein [Nostoc sp. MG11]|uniref:hypothetical protein n=1 Tax=Nostoc sp. MG11 TaxID=2721166 RepID=UPI001D01B1A8|nr:hypothetical protein [Nostoc sp. MG11]
MTWRCCLGIFRLNGNLTKLVGNFIQTISVYTNNQDSMSGRAILGLKNTVFLVAQCATSKSLVITGPNQQNVSDKGVNND